MGLGASTFRFASMKSLGKWSRFDRRTHCPFCRLVEACVFSLAIQRLPSSSATIRLANEKSWVLSSIHENYDGRRSEQYSNKWDLEEEARRTHSNHAFRFLISWDGCTRPGEIQYLAHRDPPDRRQFFGRRVDPDNVNWDVIKSWLHTCDRFHHGTCDSPGLASDRLPRHLRVIDVDEWCIVNAPRDRHFEYVALTYVWGTEREMGWRMPFTTRSHVRRHRGPGECVVDLPARLPRTIADAIEVTRLVGYRYLWVDSLCIIQDDRREKHGQMSRMDAVYNCAALTIAAGSGRHADHGLQGVSIPRRYRQHSEVVKGLRLAVCLPKFNELDSGANLHWNTRGWTFQEKLLSRRLLLFTDYQVYFRCSNAIWAEDVEMEYGRLSNSMRRRPTPFRWAPERQQRNLSTWQTLADVATLGALDIMDKDSELGYLPNYTSIVKDIMQRQFTNAEDLLPATEGIFRTLDTTGDVPFHAGLPARHINKVLLWQPLRGSSIALLQPPHTDVPSWSWAAWLLSGGCDWNDIDLRGSGKLVAGTKIDFICSHDDEYNTESRSPSRPPSGSWDAVSRYSSESSPFERPSPLCRIQVLGAKVKTDFRIGARIDSQKGSAPRDTVGDFELVDQSKRCLGEVRMTSRVAKMRGLHKFWAVSTGSSLLFAEPDSHYKPSTTRTVYIHERTGEKRNVRPQGWADGDYRTESEKVYKGREDWKVINVMLVHISGGLATRVAVGKVLKTAWDSKFWSEELVGKKTDFVLV